MRLAEKVRLIMSDDSSHLDDGVRQLPDEDKLGRQLGEFELDLRDWGLVYGMAVGIARSENPWEPLESVVARAGVAAREVYESWCGEFHQDPRTVDRLVTDMLRTWRGGRGGQPSDELDDAITKLGNTIGWPRGGREVRP